MLRTTRRIDWEPCILENHNHCLRAFPREAPPFPGAAGFRVEGRERHGGIQDSHISSVLSSQAWIGTYQQPESQRSRSYCRASSSESRALAGAKPFQARKPPLGTRILTRDRCKCRVAPEKLGAGVKRFRLPVKKFSVCLCQRAVAR